MWKMDDFIHEFLNSDIFILNEKKLQYISKILYNLNDSDFRLKPILNTASKNATHFKRGHKYPKNDHHKHFFYPDSC